MRTEKPQNFKLNEADVVILKHPLKLNKTTFERIIKPLLPEYAETQGFKFVVLEEDKDIEIYNYPEEVEIK